MKKNETGVWRLESTNLTHLGGPMGTEYTTTNWNKFFRSIENAKKFAEHDFNMDRGTHKLKKITWEQIDDYLTSGDLAFVSYDIYPVKLED